MLSMWTGQVIGKMHVYGISATALANEIGWHPKYLSQVLNERETPKGAEEKVSAALDALVSEKQRQGFLR